MGLALQHLPDGIFQIVQNNGLGHMGVHAGLQRVADVIHKGVGRHGDDGHRLSRWVLAGPDGPGCLVAVHDRHLDIHKDDVVLAGGGGFKFIHSLLAVLRGVADSPHGAEDLHQYHAVDFDIVYHHDMLLIHHIRPIADAGPLLGAQHPLDGLFEVGHKEGLGQEVLNAHLQGLLFDVLPVIGGEEQDGNLVGIVLPDEPGGLHAVQIRHLPVQQDQVVRFARLPGGAHHLNGGGAAGGVVGDDAGHRHLPHDVPADVLVVVRHDHPGNPVLLPELRVVLPLLNAQIQFHGEGTAYAGLALYADLAAHQVHQVLGDRHAQARALDFVERGALFPGEGVEDHPLVLLAHALAVIPDDELNAAVFLVHLGQLLHPHLNPAPGGSVLHRVGENVDEDLVNPQLVAQQMLLRQRAGIHLEALVLGPGLGTDDGIDFVDDLRQVQLGDIQDRAAAFDFVHVQHVVDEPQKMLAGGGDLLGVLQDPVRVAGLLLQQGHKAHDGVHGGPDVVAHVAEEGALSLAGHLGHLQSLAEGVLHLSLLGPVGDVDDDPLLPLDLHAVHALLKPLALSGLGVHPLCLHGLHGQARLQQLQILIAHIGSAGIHGAAQGLQVFLNGLLGDAQHPLHIGADKFRPLAPGVQHHVDIIHIVRQVG